jgi:hypothetical protein
MNISAIRTGIADLIRSVDGLSDCLPYTPDVAGFPPFAFLGDAVGPVTMGAREIWTYDMPLTVAVARIVDYDAETLAAEAFIEPIMQAIESDYTLSNTTMGLAVTSFRQGTVIIGDDKFVGFTLMLRVKETGVRQLS